MNGTSREDTTLDGVLSAADGPPVRVLNTDGRSPVLLVCEHASNHIPEQLGTLGLDADALASHVAWDPGAYDVALLLSELLDATLIATGFSRLVYDVNRPPESLEAVRATSEAYEIPGNRDIGDAERATRADAIYRPFHEALAQSIAHRRRAGRTTVLLTVHSFTRTYFGSERAVELGILHDSDARLADALLQTAGSCTSLATERNRPYGPRDGVTHTLARHALSNGLFNAMIEIRNDLIETPQDQERIAAELAEMIIRSLAALGIEAQPKQASQG